MDMHVLHGVVYSSCFFGNELVLGRDLILMTGTLFED